MKALGLWYLQSLTRLEIRVKNMSREKMTFFVEPHMTVEGLKILVEEAPIAAYLWVSFCRDFGAFWRPLHVEKMLKLFPWRSEA